MEDGCPRMRDKTRIAIAAGDPAGIGPEISLKAALDPAVRIGGDSGLPITLGDAGAPFVAIAREVQRRAAEESAKKGPSIEIEE